MKSWFHISVVDQYVFSPNKKNQNMSGLVVQVIQLNLNCRAESKKTGMLKYQTFVVIPRKKTKGF